MQLHKPWYAAGYYLNPSIHYDPYFDPSSDIKLGLYTCLQRMVPEVSDRKKIDVQLEQFKQAKGLFAIEVVILAKITKKPSNNFFFFFVVVLHSNSSLLVVHYILKTKTL